MKTASDAIFLLVCSLSKSEKRYFRQYAQRHTIGDKNQYLSLFDAIEAQPKYDEAALRQQFPLPSTHFAVAKQYLHEQILESLHLFHQAQSVEEQIKKQLHIAKILWRKQLQLQTRKTLDKAFKLIHLHGLTEHLTEYYALERRLQRSLGELTSERITCSHQQLNQTLQTLLRNNDYWLHSQCILSLHYQKVSVQQSDKRAELEAAAQELLQSEIPKQPATRLDYCRALATYYFMTGDARTASHYNRLQIELFEQNPALVEMEREQYVSVWSNFLIDHYSMGDYEAVEKGIAHLRQLPSQPIFRALPRLDIKILELTYSLQLNALIAQKQFVEALAVLPALQQQITQHQSRISPNYLLTFYYLLAYIYFCNRQYDQTLHYLELLLQPEHQNILEELQQAAARLRLLAHFAQGNYLLLDYLVVSVRRSQRRQKTTSGFDAALFKFLKKWSLATDKKQQNQLKLKFAANLSELKKQYPRPWNYFDFDWWVNNL